MSTTIYPTDPAKYTGTGALPDRLGFAHPSRTNAYIVVRNIGPATAGDVADRLDVNERTVLVQLGDLQDLGLVERRARDPSATHPTSVWETTDGDSA